MAQLAPLAMAAAVGSLAISVAPAAEASIEESVADFSRVCVDALLAPDALAATLKERGMAPSDTQFIPKGFDGALYSTPDNGRGINITYQRYSDLTISNCLTVAPKGASREELESLRKALEAHPRIGKLEGRFIEGGPSIKVASFKRPGNAPIVTFQFTATSSTTSLSMTRFDPKTN